jgi:hypothetical protein
MLPSFVRYVIQHVHQSYTNFNESVLLIVNSQKQKVINITC